MRKPRDKWTPGEPVLQCTYAEDGSRRKVVRFGGYELDKKRLWKTIKWLLKAADWLEEKEGER